MLSAGTVTFSEAQLTGFVLEFFWPFLRVGAMCMVAPLFGAALVPVRVRILLALAITAALVPGLPPPPPVEPLSPAGFLISVNQIGIGIAAGLLVQMLFDAMVIAGQTISMGMGLGFAMMVDPQRGVSVVVLGQFFIILGTLMFLSMDGHLALVRLLADSFHSMPVGGGGIAAIQWRELALWGSRMFEGGLQIALPAVVALLAVNLAFGVMSRAAPTLNLFAVGFPVTMTLGFVILYRNVPNFRASFGALLEDTLINLSRLLGN